MVRSTDHPAETADRRGKSRSLKAPHRCGRFTRPQPELPPNIAEQAQRLVTRPQPRPAPEKAYEAQRDAPHRGGPLSRPQRRPGCKTRHPSHSEPLVAAVVSPDHRYDRQPDKSDEHSE